MATIALTAVVLALPPPPARADGPPVSGGGSSFAALEIDQWRADVARKPYSLNINYVAQGSTFGRLQYAAGVLDFGASDIPFQPGESLGSRASFVYVPVSAGGVGFMYNLKDGSGQRVDDLKLTRHAVCRMFTEPGMRWNDPEIVAHNPRLAGVSRDVRPVVRQDGSGTSYVFSQFCTKVASDVWGAFQNLIRTTVPGQLTPLLESGAPISNWPTGWGRVTAGLAADGVANAVADPVNGQDAITYNEAGFAKERGIPNAVVQNAAGVFTAPEEEAVTVALGYAIESPSGDGTFSLDYFGGDPRAYFPSTYSYVIAQTDGFPPDKGLVLTRFLGYAVTKGQEVAVPLQYARLSMKLVDLALRQIAKIPGFPGLAGVVVEGAAPPPPDPTLNAPTIDPAAAAAAAAAAAGAGATGGGAADAVAAACAPTTAAATADSTTTTTVSPECAAAQAAAAQAAEAQAQAAAQAEAAKKAAERAMNEKRAASTAKLSNKEVFKLLVVGASLAALCAFVTGFSKRTGSRS